ncbi:ABC transporter permease [Lysobacter sp. Hz 25]|uniref:ABC transporter permease n=1 Tax=Lysobacter sp. Hz 25 TaxID=3383698 RepID=UPI0038D4832E
MNATTRPADTSSVRAPQRVAASAVEAAPGAWFVLGEAFHAALRQLRSFPVRTAVAMLSVALGVAGIVSVASLSEGLSRTLVRSFESMGRQVLIVRSDPSYESLVLGRANRLSERDLRVVAAAFARRPVAPLLRYGAFNNPVALGARKSSAAIYGTTVEYFRLGEVELIAGAWPSRQDWRGSGRQCLLGRSLAAELGGTAAVLGRDLSLAARSCRVVGVVKGAGNALGFDAERLVVAPIGLVRAMDADGSLSDLEIHAGFSGDDDIEAIGRRLSTQLRKQRHVVGGEDDFIVVTAQRLRGYLDDTLASVRAGLFLLMAVVFAVAALGIGNVMVSGVNARRREIAIKRAIGASRANVFLEFLLEAVILTGFGGVLGVVLGAAAALAITSGSSYFGEPTVSWSGCLFGVVTALLVGLSTGVWPAARAARLDPVAGLHHH